MINFVTKYGTRQGIVVRGRVAPFGIGMGIGAAMGAVNAAIVIKATRRASAQYSEGRRSDLEGVRP